MRNGPSQTYLRVGRPHGLKSGADPKRSASSLSPSSWVPQFAAHSMLSAAWPQQESESDSVRTVMRSTQHTPPSWVTIALRRVGTAAVMPLPALCACIDGMHQLHSRACADSLRRSLPQLGLGDTVIKHFEGRFGGVQTSLACQDRLASLVASLQRSASHSELARSFAQSLGVPSPGTLHSQLPNRPGSAPVRLLAKTTDPAQRVPQLLASSRSIGINSHAHCGDDSSAVAHSVSTTVEGLVSCSASAMASSSRHENFIETQRALTQRAFAQPRDASNWGDRSDHRERLHFGSLPHDAVHHPAVAMCAEHLLSVPAARTVLHAVAAGSHLPALRAIDLGVEITPGCGVALDLLLLEACSILGVKEAPALYIKPSSEPYLLYLELPAGESDATQHSILRADSADISSATESVAESVTTKKTVWRRRPAVVVSTAAVQLLSPWELQAAMANALSVSAAQDDGRSYASADTVPSPATLASACGIARAAPHLLQVRL